MKRFYIVLLLTICFAGSTYAQENASVTISDTGKTIISRQIYGQFAEHLGRSIYDGFYRNGHIRMDIVAALKRIKIPNLRWPGGCFADQYHWRDGIGPQAKRPKTVNTTWGMVTEDNSFGTAEFMELCRLIGCEPYIAGNVGTGSPQEMKEWIEYLNFGGNSTMAKLRAANGHPAPYRVSLWGVGNESWGCGGNMTPEYYANLYKQFAAFCPDYPGAPMKLIISGPNAGDYNWTKVMMQNIGPYGAYGLSMHYYTIPTGNWDHKGSATHFSDAEYFNTMKQALKMEVLINKHSAIMDQYDPKKRMALLVDEWGIWTDVEPGTNPAFMFQQNSLRDALMAASTLNIFNNHADRVRGANLAQTVNVIHSLVLTKGDQMVLTPTYFVFDLYKVHQDARLMPLRVQTPYYHMGNDSIPAVNASASVDRDGKIHITLVNLDPDHSIRITSALKVSGQKAISGQILTSAKLTDCNTFTEPGKLNIKPFTRMSLKDGQLVVEMPAKSVVEVEVR